MKNHLNNSSGQSGNAVMPKGSNKLKYGYLLKEMFQIKKNIVKTLQVSQKAARTHTSVVNVSICF